MTTRPGGGSQALALAVLLSVGAPTVGAPGPTARADPTLTGCGAALSGIDRAYAVSGRVRLLLVWSGRHDVGRAHITWSGDGSGASRYDLLIGTDPDVAPRHLNRWGYESETRCADSHAGLVGLMTQTDDDAVGDATAEATIGAAQGPAQRFKAVRETVADGVSSAEIIRLSVGGNPTYHDVRTLLDGLPAAGVPRRTPVAEGTDPGLLTSVAAILHATVQQYVDDRQVETPIRREYVYAGHLYSLTLRHARTVEVLDIGPATYHRAIEGQFEIRNLTTRETTSFQMAYGTGDGLAEVPLRIRYHPHWWLELDLTLEENAHGVRADDRDRP
jgi:hypothetical protein